MKGEVVRVDDDGVLLHSATQEGENQELWLKKEEWSDDPAVWTRARDSIALGAKLDVVDLGQTDEIGRRLVSQSQVALRHVDSTWPGSQRVLRVESYRTQIRGSIGSVPAFVPLTAYNRTLERSGIPPAMLDHKWLAKGDYLSGTVIAVDPALGEVELQPDLAVARFTRSDFVDVAHDERSSESQPRLPALAALDRQCAERISPLLLIEDDPDCRDELTECLRRNSVIVVALGSYEDARRYLEKDRSISELETLPSQIRFAVIDANLENGSDRLGLEVADRLAVREDLPVLVISGEPTNREKAAEWGELLVRDYVEKPFMIAELFEAITASLAVSPTPLRELLLLGGESGQGQAAVRDRAHERGSQDNAKPDWQSLLSPILAELEGETPGAVTAVFRLHPRSWRAECISSHGGEIDWQSVRGKIGKSRIKDAVEESDPIVEGQCAPIAAHLWTGRMLSYRSFYGVRLDVVGHFTYVLVAFHNQEDAFSQSFQSAALLARERLARIIGHELLAANRMNESAFASSGLAFECLAHEVRGHLVTHDSLAENLAGILKDKNSGGAEQLRRIQGLAGRLQRVVAITIEKARALGGWRGRHEKVLVWHALQQAVNGCRRALPRVLAHSTAIELDDPIPENTDDLVIEAPPGALAVVLFNVYLNAAQQIDMMHPMRPHGRVWHSVRSKLDAFGSPWAVVAISDNGPGIHYDDWETVFEPGYSTKPDGTGLGLSICRDLVTRISSGDRRAAIFVGQSTIWGGTTFVLNLPLVSRSEKGASA